VVQVVECLSSKDEALSSNPRTKKKKKFIGTIEKIGRLAINRVAPKLVT
jgi:hypothetical protein